jgi:hypothetical protein
MFLRHDEFASFYYSAQLTLTVAQENEALSVVQRCSALEGGWER